MREIRVRVGVGGGERWKVMGSRKEQAVSRKGEQGHQELNLDPSSRDNGAPTPPDGHHPDTLSYFGHSIQHKVCISTW
jgi:hypothetical protein